MIRILMVVLFLFPYIVLFAATVLAEEMFFEKFLHQPATRWVFISDAVMGGKSFGKIEFLSIESESFARMTGSVSLENNGGFIQFRRELSDYLPEKKRGLRVRVRGNVEKYFVHLRTTGTFLPWQYYQADFLVTEKWQLINLPFSKFRRSGLLIPKSVKAQNIRSIGLVAFGKRQEVLIDVEHISIY